MPTGPNPTNTVYRLLSGKVHRFDGLEHTILKAPCEFVPTEAELAVNRYRMEPVRGISGAGISGAAAISAGKKDIAQKDSDISKSDTISALQMIADAQEAELLEELSVQEAGRKPSARLKILRAIEQRRIDLQGAPVREEVIP